MEHTGLPCVVKPVMSSSGKGQSTVRRAEEMERAWDYAVANMPGAVARTSTLALTNATFPYVLEIANHGVRAAARNNPAIAQGVNIARGQVLHPDLAGDPGALFELGGGTRGGARVGDDRGGKHDSDPAACHPRPRW